MALVQQLALVSESNRVTFGELAVVSAALQKQATRDLRPIWEIDATVDVFERLEDVPLGYWPMIVQDDIGFDAAGIHLFNDGTPYALISSSDDNDVWSLTASHECLEMLVDPWGDRTIAGDSPKPDQGRVQFLVEVCDPSEAAEFGYSVNGVLVSDFYTPHFFDPVASAGVRYSFTDAIAEPRDVLRGGYLSWMEPGSNHWWQETWFSGSSSRFRDLGPISAQNGSIRSQIDRLTGEETYNAMMAGRRAASAAGLTVAANQRSTSSRAESWRLQIDEVVGRAAERPTASALERRGARRNRRSGRDSRARGDNHGGNQ